MILKIDAMLILGLLTIVVNIFQLIIQRKNLVLWPKQILKKNQSLLQD